MALSFSPATTRDLFVPDKLTYPTQSQQYASVILQRLGSDAYIPESDLYDFPDLFSKPTNYEDVISATTIDSNGSLRRKYIKGGVLGEAVALFLKGELGLGRDSIESVDPELIPYYLDGYDTFRVYDLSDKFHEETMNVRHFVAYTEIVNGVKILSEKDFDILTYVNTYIRDHKE